MYYYLDKQTTYRKKRIKKGVLIMSYQEFRKTYARVLKRFSYEITNIFNKENLSMKTERFVKSGSRWVLVESTEKAVPFEFYFNVLDSIDFMRNLGGYEKTEKAYTTQGYIPVRQISISPDRTKKTVFSFDFSNITNIQ